MISQENIEDLATFSNNEVAIKNDGNIKIPVCMNNAIRIYLLTALIVIALPTTSFAQSQDTIRTESVFRFEVITPGLSYEAPVGLYSTLRVKVSMYSLARSIYVFSERKSGLSRHTFPHADLQYRLYTNLTKRSVTGKTIHENSGNYISLKVLILFPETLAPGSNHGNSTWIGPVYGLQRKFSSRLSIDLAAGIGYQILASDNELLFPMAAINLAYTIKSKR